MTVARIVIPCLMFLITIGHGLAQDASDLAKLSPDVLTKDQQKDAAGMIGLDNRRRGDEANARNREEWSKITTKEQWEKYRDERIDLLRKSLGEFPKPGKPNIKVTNVIKGDGFHIENTLYESRPGQWVDGNLYVPAEPKKGMPGILIAHAHHNGKRDGELQDMGMTWARAGCCVLVINQVGYQERRAHPFNKDSDYAKSYRTSRQDYYFRYDSGIQLQLLGDSLMGWFAWDLMRGVDLLLAREGVDPKKIIILGAVAGGGDPAGVTAALDQRIACCVPFNFGGPQPETKFPLPEDAEKSYNYVGWTYWDSTRGLPHTGSDGFFHWTIVSSIAPRHLIHAHEFAWDKDRDPVWKRYQRVWGDFYKAADHIGVTHGSGSVRGRPPESTHCNHIGKVHRQMIHPLFEKWFGIKVEEYRMPRMSDELTCWTDAARQELKPRSLPELTSALGQERIEKAREKLAGKSPEEQRTLLRDGWTKLLGPITPAKPVVKSQATDEQSPTGMKVERLVLETEAGIVVPVIVLSPAKANGKVPVVVGFAQAGKAGFLKERSEDVLKLVKGGAVVVLPDLRGTGESRSGTSGGRDSSRTDHSTYVQMHGETMVGQRLRDLRSVLAYVRTRGDVDSKKIALWGDSFTPPNPKDTDFKVPHGVDGRPKEAEPLGGVLALLGALYEDDVRAVYVSGGLASYHSVLTNYAVTIPHDASVPGALTQGDLCDLAGSLAPRPLRFEAMVDHMNRAIEAADVQKAYGPTVKSYASVPKALSFGASRTPAVWLLLHLQ